MSISYPLFVNLTGRDPGPNPSIVVGAAANRSPRFPRIRHGGMQHVLRHLACTINTYRR